MPMESADGYSNYPQVMNQSDLPEAVQPSQRKCPGSDQNYRAEYSTTLADFDHGYPPPPPRQGSSADTGKILALSREGGFRPLLRKNSLLIALCIALLALSIAFLVGFITERNKNTDAQHTIQRLGALQNTSCSVPTPSTTSSSQTGPGEGPSKDHASIFTSGCPENGNNTLTSVNVKVPYTLFCSTNWVGYNMGAIITSTVSDCVEACWTINHYNEENKKEGATNCVGVTWVPGWVNASTISMNVAKVPGNCFFKSFTVGLPANDPAGGEFVVARLEPQN